MRVIMFARKPVACDALEYMLSMNATIVCIVTDPPDPRSIHKRNLYDVAVSHDIPVVDEQVLYDSLRTKSYVNCPDLSDIDLVISMFHQRRIRKPVLGMASIGEINIHPAPLPEFQGWGVYNMAILENTPYWGASAHFMDEGFDTGPLIDQERFDVDMSRETCLSLEQRTQPAVDTLFRRVFDKALQHGKLDGSPQVGGRTIRKSDFLQLRQIQPDDSAELISRKIRAFWYPPYQGATITLHGTQYTILDDRMMQALGSELFDCDVQSSDAIRAWIRASTQ
ncbi:MAG: hypothetical protein Phyf2KO_11650 [Phycisphaerales bacterium]